MIALLLLERRVRLLRLAIARRDLLAIAILTADRQYRPEPDYPILAGLRWIGSRAA